MPRIIPQHLRRLAWRQPIERLVRAIRDNDQAGVDAAIVRISRSRRWLAPLALTVGAVAMLLEGVRLIFSNWRLTLVQVLPAMWIWAAMLDLKAHLLYGKSFHLISGPVVIPVILAVTAVTAACFFLNAVFAFAIATPGQPHVRPAFTRARSHLTAVLGWGTAVGLALGVSTVLAPRRGLALFTVSLGIVLGVMMVCYVAVPARLIGMRTTYSRRDSLTASMMSGAIGAIVCTPPYVLGRVGLLMLGSHTLFIPGLIVLALGLTLQAGATSAVKAVKMGARLAAGHQPPSGKDAADGPPERTAPRS